MRIIGLDPGPKESGFVVWQGGRVHWHGIEANEVISARLAVGGRGPALLAVEMIASYGMAVGKDVFDTCVWVGRFVEAWVHGRFYTPDFEPRRYRLVYRRDVKCELCGSARATDANVREALVGRIGPPGTKAAPGPTYGLKSHEWSALGVAVVAEALEARAREVSLAR